MARWECERCGRGFGRAGQGHVCVPALSLDDYFGVRPPGDRAIFKAVAGHLRSLGPIDIEAVGVGVLFKRGRTIVELRPMKRWLALSIVLPRRLDDPRVTRGTPMTGGRVANAVRLWCAEDIDADVRGWLTESYTESGW